MKPSSCLSPVRIYNKALHTFMNVPCGHCPACQVIKGYRRSEKVNAAFNQFHYRYFVTLTYRDECLPLAKYDPDTGCFYSNDCDYNGEFYHVSLDDDCLRFSSDNVKDWILDNVNKFGGVPVLSHSDAIKFKKRFRKFVYGKLGYYPTIFWYLAGEYGPLHYRPHLHLCIGFDDARLVPIFRSCVCDAWRMYNKYSSEIDLRLIGKIDIQPVVGRGCIQYCAQYLNCSTNLPAFLERTSFRPFYQKSCTSDYELRRTSSDNLQDVYDRCSITQTFVDSLSYSESTTLCSDLYRNRYFPKCASFGALSHYERVTLYGTFLRYYQSAFDPCSGSATGQRFADFVLNEKEKFFYSSTQSMRLLFLYFCTGDNFQSIVKLKRLWYVSKRVCLNASSLGVSVDDYVSKIEEFWYKIEMDKLARFYNSQIDMMSDPQVPVPLSSVFNMYFDTSDKIHYFNYYRDQFGVEDQRSFCPQFLPRQVEYSTKMNRIALDNTKTKKRNDDFEHRGIKRRPYLFLPSRHKRKFLNLF